MMDGRRKRLEVEESEEILSRGDVAKLIAEIGTKRGFDLSQYRTSYVERRLGSRLRALGLTTYRQYSCHLAANPEEYARLLDTLTINVTEFFRDPPVWDIIRHKLVPSLMHAKAASGHRSVRAWSAGCATGEEVYSIAMSLLSVSAKAPEELTVSVLGTDLDRQALATAARATYDISKLAHIPHHERNRFIEIGEDEFRIKPEVRDRARFQHLDLFSGTLPRSMDLILCRNVFIYFTREQQHRVIEGYHKSLNKGGYLVLGRTERMPPDLSEGFEPLSSRERIYRRR